VAVLVNDFGSINIDAELIVGVERNVISLTNGCICCSLRDDLIKTVMETINRPERPEYILLEASGVAEPSGIAITFNNPDLRQHIRLDSIICVLDAEQVFAATETMELKIFQIAWADMVILNKVDLVDRKEIDKIKEWLDSRFNRYRLIEATHCDVPLPILLSVGRFDAIQVKANTSQSDHAKTFSTWSYETDRPLSLEALRETASRLPVGIYRAKGVIYAADEPQRRVILQVVGRRVDISLGETWGGRPARTQIVAIGAPGAIDEETLRNRFEHCIYTSPQ